MLARMEIAHSPSRMFSCEVRFGQGKLGYLLYCFKGQFLKKLTLLESFKVVPLFSYQGPLCCLPTGATLISYHVFPSLSTTFLIYFFLFAACLSSEDNITIWFPFCQQFFWIFFLFFSCHMIWFYTSFWTTFSCFLLQHIRIANESFLYIIYKVANAAK